jgi:hypothetical protein
MAEAGQEEPELGLNAGKDGAGHLVAAHMVGMVGGSGGRRARHRLRFGACGREKKIREMYTEKIREMYTEKNSRNVHGKNPRNVHTQNPRNVQTKNMRNVHTKKQRSRKKNNFRNARKRL